MTARDTQTQAAFDALARLSAEERRELLQQIRKAQREAIDEAISRLRRRIEEEGASRR